MENQAWEVFLCDRHYYPRNIPTPLTIAGGGRGTRGGEITGDWQGSVPLPGGGIRVVTTPKSPAWVVVSTMCPSGNWAGEPADDCAGATGWSRVTPLSVRLATPADGEGGAEPRMPRAERSHCLEILPISTLRSSTIPSMSGRHASNTGRRSRGPAWRWMTPWSDAPD